MNYSVMYNNNGRECLYFRKYSNNNIEWWSFHHLTKQEIIDEIYCYLIFNRSNPIYVKSDYCYIEKSDLFRKRKDTILKLIIDNNDFDNFHYIILEFKNFCVLLFKKGYEVI